MFPGELPVVGSPAGVVIFHAPFIIALCIYTFAGGVPTLAKLVEDVLELKMMTAVFGLESKICHGSEAHVVIVLVVYASA